VGYTFDMDYTPRVFLGGAYFEGSKDDCSFNRLFSNWEYSMFDDAFDANSVTNFWTVRGGVSVMPTESLKVVLAGGYFGVVEDTKDQDPVGNAGNLKDDIGWEIDTSLSYAYTKDLSFEVGYAHFFTGDALGTDTDDYDYFYGETKLCF